jgi:riboflavin-specific deaminase-like protein
MLRLHPDPAELEPAEAITGLGLGALAPPDRPYVVCNMVSSVDGRVAVQGRSGSLGTELDRQVFHLLRTQADAVLVGTGTLRAERYGRLVRDPVARERRVAEGLAPDPIAFVISRSGDVPWDIPLFQDPETVAVIATASPEPPPEVPATVHVMRFDPDELTPASALARLRAEHDVRSVLSEGGPLLNGAMLAEDVFDELFLSLSPVLAGGDPMTMVTGELSELVWLELVWVLEGDGMLFLRYRVRR